MPGFHYPVEISCNKGLDLTANVMARWRSLQMTLFRVSNDTNGELLEAERLFAGTANALPLEGVMFIGTGPEGLRHRRRGLGRNLRSDPYLSP